MSIKDVAYLRRHDFANVLLYETAEFLRKIILLHEAGVVFFLIFHVGFQHIEQGETELLFLCMRINLFREEQNHMLVLPIIFDGILGIEPRTIKHLIYIVVIPLLHLIQFVLDDVHPVEDEEHMKLWIALEIVVYSILYHILGCFINTDVTCLYLFLLISTIWL